MTSSVAASLPSVSVVMAAYNYGRYLTEAIESALAQDYPPDRLELIVVDDGSTDDTPEIGMRYAKGSEGRVRYIRQDNAGAAAATSRGLREARGDLIAPLDADDVWLASRTRLLVEALARNPRAGLVYGDMEVIDEHGRTVAASWLQEAAQTPYRGRVVRHLLRANFVMTSSLMVRGELRDRISAIPPSFPVQDWYMLGRAAEVAEVDFVPARVARYRRHGANMIHGKQSASEVAAWLRRDVPMRRWMLANLRSSELTVEDFAAAYDYFWQTMMFAAGSQNVSPESFVEVSDADREAERRRHTSGAAALAEGDFDGAAGHFLAALAADPFSIRAREGLDHAKQRLIVPTPRRAAAATGHTYRIKPGYTSREAPAYYVDLAGERTGVVQQPDVYTRAAEVAGRTGATRIIDLGTGGGAKLAALASRFEILGLDHGPNVELARRSFPEHAWREHDLDSAGRLPLTAEQLEGSVVICAGVIEHLLRPELLLDNLRELLPSVRAVVLSTPERDLTHGPDSVGPPADPTRAREWNISEFAALLEEWGFEHGELGLTRSDSAGAGQTTILAVLYPDAEAASI